MHYSLLYFILVLIAINLFGFERYITFSMSEVAYRKQALIDFIAPIGSILGRIFFGFSMKENIFGYILGFLFEIFITIFFVIFIF
jgi:nicotinamide riboside transporter PnuC